ncbi:MAG: 1-deoxy-D-xylulose-5-phosphate synthase [Phycisphaerae bacterium]
MLDRIQTPDQIKHLDIGELESLAGEMREAIIKAVGKNGGHLASNLGVVELTLALHYVYDFGPHPTGPDRLLFDVGHQAYPHKLLTGRLAGFERLRKAGGNSGFPDPSESDYDLFAVGHAGTAISTGVGLARADGMQGRPNHVVAVVGDASIVNGLAFEGLNNAGTLKRQMLIVLNDNGMSISQPQGAIAEYLERVRVSTTYDEFKKVSRKILGHMPGGIGENLRSAYHSMTEGLKGAIWAGQLFEAMGIKYMGPIDGHDLPGLINFLSEIKHVDAPVLLHVKTVKGKGHDASVADPTMLHSPAAFNVNGCRVEIIKKDGKSWTKAFAEVAIELANDDKRVVALTAAMPDGTGLSAYQKVHPERFIDTGICESHLAAMAAGMAKNGLRPLAAVYSTFTQRCFDQIWQEVVLNKVPVMFAMDRAGFVGSDGAVHHGFMDQAFLRPMPGMVLLAPSDEMELKRMLKLQLSLASASAVRYPRDDVPALPFEDAISPALRDAARAPIRLGQSRVLREGSDATIIAYGSLATEAMLAAEELAAAGIDTEVIDARFCKPLDEAMLARVLTAGRPLVTVEDHAAINGFGTAVAEHAVAAGLPTEHLTILGIPDRFIGHKGRGEQLAEAGLDAAGIVATVKRRLGTPQTAVVN